MDDMPTPTPSAENTARKQRGRPFEPGRSGNPSGRPKGSRNRATLAIESLLEGEADAIVRKAIEKAKEGDSTALRLCIERLLPQRRDRVVTFELPDINVAGAAEISASVFKACSEGTLSPREAFELMELIQKHQNIRDATDIEARLASLEQQVQEW